MQNKLTVHFIHFVLNIVNSKEFFLYFFSLFSLKQQAYGYYIVVKIAWSTDKTGTDIQ